MTHITRTNSSTLDRRRGTEGDVASRVFERIERGTPVDAIVVELGLTPDVVESLLRTWARLRGLVPLTADGADALRRALYKDHVFKDGAELLAALRSFAARVSLVCRQCGDGSADYCTACPGREARNASARKAKRGRRRDPASDGAGTRDAGETDQTPGLLSAEFGAEILRAATRGK